MRTIKPLRPMKLYVFDYTLTTDRGSVNMLRRSDNGKRVRISRKRFNQLCEDNRVYFPADYQEQQQ